MDPISDLFISIKNAQKAGHETARVPYSLYKHEIVRALAHAGFVGEAQRRGKRVRKFLEIPLIMRDGVPAVREVRLFSKPSRRISSRFRTLPVARYGGVVLITTSRGVMTSEEARKKKVGGQVLAEVW
ncbi:MAG: 30S ribosomal protein S8 [Candidatus Sungbacteria bacterium]|nr:30S ribosomal protein S8 [Candidatus Sungbacteria bacterium]